MPLAQSSHAVSEIHTSKGWLGVDSLEPFMLLTKNNLPTTYRSALVDLEAYPVLRRAGGGFYTGKIDVIYGLYSRHGHFHRKKWRGPEYDFNELLWNWS